jgi:hypothetical protein
VRDVNSQAKDMNSPHLAPPSSGVRNDFLDIRPIGRQLSSRRVPRLASRLPIHR